MRKNNALIFIEENGYRLIELRGTQVPVFKLSGPDSELEFAVTSPNQYQPSRQPTALEQEMINRIFQELQANELKFIYYDFSLDNNE
jgi:hypothetical protein